MKSPPKTLEDYNKATSQLLDLPIRDETEYKKCEEWLKKWSDPKITQHLPLPQDWVDKLLDQMISFKKM